MLKKSMIALTAPIALIAGTVVADDDMPSVVAELESAGLSSSVVDVRSDPIGRDLSGQADVAALLGDGEESDEDAIAAGYRSFRGVFGGIGGFGGSRNFGRRSSGYGYRGRSTSVYRRYSYCSPVVYYSPVQYCRYTPVYTSYWGCW